MRGEAENTSMKFPLAYLYLRRNVSVPSGHYRKLLFAAWHIPYPAAALLGHGLPTHPMFKGQAMGPVSAGTS